MIELDGDSLVFSFPEVHRDAVLRVDFQRTLRIPDDGKEYPLPAGLGRFPLRHVDDFAADVPEHWLRHGGVMLPMYQAEAMWINLSSRGYPFAVKVGTGKIDAITGEGLRERLHRHPQDYLVAPIQPWLDGFCVEKGVIRQFVAVPLGDGDSVEEQLTGEAEHGGLQLLAYPLKADAWEAMQRRRFQHSEHVSSMVVEDLVFVREMGLAPGGRMRQEVYQDPHALSDWDLRHGSRCFVHLTNSLAWGAITGEQAPATPLTPHEYARRGIPWFDYYEERSRPVAESGVLAGVQSLAERRLRTGRAPLAHNESLTPERIVELRRGLRPGEVRGWELD